MKLQTINLDQVTWRAGSGDSTDKIVSFITADSFGINYYYYGLKSPRQKKFFSLILRVITALSR